MLAPWTSHITIAARPFLHSQKSALTDVNITYIYIYDEHNTFHVLAVMMNYGINLFNR